MKRNSEQCARVHESYEIRQIGFTAWCHASSSEEMRACTLHKTQRSKESVWQGEQESEWERAEWRYSLHSHSNGIIRIWGWVHRGREENEQHWSKFSRKSKFSFSVPSSSSFSSLFFGFLLLFIDSTNFGFFGNGCCGCGSGIYWKWQSS